MSDFKILPGFGRERLQGELVKAGMLNGVEVGVQCGEHAESLLRAGVRDLTLVDMWAQSPKHFDLRDPHDAHHQENYLATLRRMEHYPERVRIIRGASVEMTKHFFTGEFDFVYIDANHSLEAVRADLRAWYPKLRPGGWMCGHDFMVDYSIGVEVAVLEFVQELGIETLFVCETESHPNWHFIKP